MPLGPSESVSAILLVKGGEISGKSVTALTAAHSHLGSESRVTAKAKIKPSTVPATPAEQPKRMLFTAACRSYQLSTKGRRFSSVKLPSAVKAIASRRTSG